MADVTAKEFCDLVLKAIKSSPEIGRCDITVKAVSQDAVCNGCSNTVTLEVQILINGLITDLDIEDAGDVMLHC